MKKLLLVAVLTMALPAVGLSQGNVLLVSSLAGKVEYRPTSNKGFQPLTTSINVKVGDEVKTGPGASVVLTLPDHSYMTVNENSDVTIKDSWSGGYHDIVNVLLGRVRVYIEKVGGRPNNSRVQTPTALIAVRGTVFDVNVLDPKFTEVWCLEGQVEVENPAVADRQVILNPGMKTGVVEGQPPLKPVEKNEDLTSSRTLVAVKKGSEKERNVDSRDMEKLLRDNDRTNRPTDSYKAPASGADNNVGRAKLQLKYPE